MLLIVHPGALQSGRLWVEAQTRLDLRPQTIEFTRANN